MDGQNAVLNFRPLISVRAERVAEVIGVTIEEANRLLSREDTKSILEAALSQAFQEAVFSVMRQMSRVPTVSVTGPRVDCTVALPALPNFISRVG